MFNRGRGRRHWLVVASAFLLAAAATGLAVAHDSGPAQAQAAATATGTAAGSRALAFGLDYSDTLPWESDGQLAASLQDAVDVGAKWIRVDLAWEDYQSTSAAFAPDFSRFDRVVAAANARGLHILATIDFPPVWARESGCSPNPACPPAQPSQYAGFAAEAAAHYAPMGLHDWEIWNEPNIKSWAPAPDPAAYARLLSKATRAIHGVDSSAFVVLGGLAASRPHPGDPYVAAPDFVREVAAAGGLGGVDAVGYHPYPNQNVAGSDTVESIASTPDNLVSALSQAGAPTMPIWITETGFSIAEEVKSAPNATTVRYEESQQAQVAKDLVHVLANTPNVTAMFWFSDQDKLSANLTYGLRTQAGVRRPVFDALKSAIGADLAGKG
ncbi:MAG TPA: cellulase family glycosylhydrolase [Actinospica sp.]|nr:cellulase family glycosylhydrolase [Actinospica sp.]